MNERPPSSKRLRDFRYPEAATGIPSEDLYSDNVVLDKDAIREDIAEFKRALSNVDYVSLVKKANQVQESVQGKLLGYNPDKV